MRLGELPNLKGCVPTGTKAVRGIAVDKGNRMLDSKNNIALIVLLLLSVVALAGCKDGQSRDTGYPGGGGGGGHSHYSDSNTGRTQ